MQFRRYLQPEEQIEIRPKLLAFEAAPVEEAKIQRTDQAQSSKSGWVAGGRRGTKAPARCMMAIPMERGLPLLEWETRQKLIIVQRRSNLVAFVCSILSACRLLGWAPRTRDRIPLNRQNEDESLSENYQSPSQYLRHRQALQSRLTFNPILRLCRHRALHLKYQYLPVHLRPNLPKCQYSS